MAFIRKITDPLVSDQELVRRYQDTQNIDLLGQLYSRYMDLVYGVCLKYLAEPEPAQDAVMNIFEELVRKLHLHQVENFRSWLHTLAKNHCLMFLRSAKNKGFSSLNPDIVQSGEELHLDDVFDKEEHFNRLDKCIDGLSGEQKETIRMFYLEEKSYKEISTLTGKDWPKVKSLVQNGRRNLKICMDQHSE